MLEDNTIIHGLRTENSMRGRLAYLWPSVIANNAILFFRLDLAFVIFISIFSNKNIPFY